MENNRKKILEVKNLSVHFPIFGGIFLKKKGAVKAVDGVSFSVMEGETLGLVGESGSGKSTLGKCLMNVLKASAPDVELQGSVIIDPETNPADLMALSKKELLDFRKDIQMVFQDPYASLNPRMIVQDIIKEPMDIHFPNMTEKEKADKVAWLMEKVGLSPEQAGRYPHEFSGGQRQRIGIARSLATEPRIIIADEPVSALDVSIQAQVINLLEELKEEFNLTLIFIAHDLAVVEHLSDRIAVMYLGDIVEVGEAEHVYATPRHPYTASLISAIPQLDPSKRNRKRIKLTGEIPSPLAKPSGCGFRKRCPFATEECSKEKPAYRDMSGTQIAACIHPVE